MKTIQIIIFLMFATVLISCSDGENTIPPDVSYTVTVYDIIPNIKRALDVRLNKKVSKNTLRSIALKIKNEDPKKYERTFICYYLSGMEIGAGAWATTHFDPNLEVKILGLTIQQENKLKNLKNSLSGEIIGSWIDDFFANERITIYKKNNRFYMKKIDKNGYSYEREFIKKYSSDGIYFQEKDRDTTDYYLINSAGNLEVRDKEGWIYTAKKIK